MVQTLLKEFDIIFPLIEASFCSKKSNSKNPPLEAIASYYSPSKNNINSLLGVIIIYISMKKKKSGKQFHLNC